MKRDNFDIPSYKFYFVRNETSFPIITKYGYQELLLQKEKKYSLIPYEEVEGLLFDDIVDIFKSEIFLGCFCEFESIGKRTYRLPIFLASMYSLNESDVDFYKITNKPVDEVITKHLEQKYAQASDYEKRIYRCFFERYQDLSHNATVERVKRIEKNN